MIKMSLGKQLEYLKDTCIEALETKIKGLPIVSIKVQDTLEGLKNLSATTDDIVKLYDLHRDEWIDADRKWFSRANIIIGGVNISYCFDVAEEVDPDSATLIMYRVYRCMEVSGLGGEDFGKKTLAIKSIAEGGAGPTGVEMNAITNNLGGVIQGLLPMFQSLMQSKEFTTVVEKTIPKGADANKPPDVESVVKTAMGVFESPEGKELFNKITGTLQQIPKK